MTFKHQFKNGDLLTLEVDLKGKLPKFICSPSYDKLTHLYSLREREEYWDWMSQIVVPMVMDKLSPEQVLACAQIGFNRELPGYE
jgi:hypothetical protein